MKSLFGKLFGKKSEARKNEQRGKAAHRNEPQRRGQGLYTKGDVIGGKYEVLDTLGKGGFGVVFLVHCRDTREVCALKTFRDELLADPAAREAFKREALVWVKLEEHPFILTARWIEEVFGRLFVLMDHIAPDDQGRVSLADHIARAGGPLGTNKTLIWAIQFCLGMEHAKAHGVRCHRDIKPANILILEDGTLKISDFGLAAATEEAWRAVSGRAGSLVTRGAEGGFGLSLIQTGPNFRCGTPGYIAPEVYRFEGADIRSDIYSFGLVLWQMAAGSRVPPFLVAYRDDIEGNLQGIYEQQMTARVPRVEGPLGPVIERCLRPSPAERYENFRGLRAVLETMLERIAGKRIEVSEAGEKPSGFWNNKGGALDALGRHDEAIRCFDKALAIDPQNAPAWNNKGNTLIALGRREEAIPCYDKSIVIDSRNAGVWDNKGNALCALGRHEEATACYDKALAIDPRQPNTWYNKGVALGALDRREEAIRCYDKALAIDQRHASAWNNKGNALDDLGQHEEAIICHDQALAIDPRYAPAWINKGGALDALGRSEEAIRCFDMALAIDAQCANAWDNKSKALFAIGRYEESIQCCDKALAIDQRDAIAWFNKGVALCVIGRHVEAIGCYGKTVAIDPRNAKAWMSKGAAHEAVGRTEEAMSSYRKFIELARPQDAKLINLALQRLQELTGRP